MEECFSEEEVFKLVLKRRVRFGSGDVIGKDFLSLVIAAGDMQVLGFSKFRNWPVGQQD